MFCCFKNETVGREPKFLIPFMETDSGETSGAIDLRQKEYQYNISRKL